MAEKEMGTKMKTPKVMPKEHPYAPVKYDVEEVQLKDFDDDEDKDILDSIKFAEKKTGHKMGTPKVLPKEHAYAPVKYDVEELSQKDSKYVHNAINGVEKPSDDEKLMTHSHMHLSPYTSRRQRAHALSYHEDYDSEIHHLDSQHMQPSPVEHLHMTNHSLDQKDDKEKDDKKKDEKKEEVAKKEEKKEEPKEVKKEEKVLQKEHDKKVEELKPLLNDAKELEKIKKDIKD